VKLTRSFIGFAGNAVLLLCIATQAQRIDNTGTEIRRKRGTTNLCWMRLALVVAIS
jgi:hypothetical protein